MSAPATRPERLAFPVEEYRSRVARMQEWLTANDVACALVTQPEHYAWLSGYEPTSVFYHQALVVPAESGAPPTLLHNKAEEVLARETCWVEDLESIWTHEDQIARTVALLARRGFHDGQRLEPGDVLLVEVTGVARRYHCNEVRNVAVGEPGIVLTLETGILADEGSLLLGTNVHVTEAGPVVLNEPPMELLVAG